MKASETTGNKVNAVVTKNNTPQILKQFIFCLEIFRDGIS